MKSYLFVSLLSKFYPLSSRIIEVLFLEVFTITFYVIFVNTQFSYWIENCYVFQ